MRPRDALGLTLVAVASAAALPEKAVPPAARRGYAVRPPGATPSSRLLPDDCVEFFERPDIDGARDRVRPVAEHQPGKARNMRGYLKDAMSSVQWKLPRGVVVVLYEHSGARGGQLPIWGDGEFTSVTAWDIDDRVSRWAWYYVGGTDHPSRAMIRGLATRPPGARPTRAPLGRDTMFLFIAEGYKGMRQPIRQVTATPARVFHPVSDDLDRTVKSLQWDLPLGVVVILSEHADGRGGLYAVWGQGEISTTRRWGSGGAVSAWAWFHVGDAPAEQDPAP